MVQSIATLVEAVNLAQARGAYTMEQSAQILPSLQKCTEFVNESVKNSEKQKEKMKLEEDELETLPKNQL